MRARLTSAEDFAGQIRADICIVGTGPVGQAVARQLVGETRDVVMLEAGSAEADRWGRRMASAVTPAVGRQYPNPADNVQIRLGGTSGLWGLQVHPDPAKVGHGLRLGRLHGADLDPPPGTGRTRWPVGPGELAPFFDRAEAMFGVPTGRNSEPEPFADDRLVLDPMWATDAGPFLRPDDIAVRIVSDCVAHQVQIGRDGRVVGLRASSRSGRPIEVKADVFVLALGAVQTTRLLLNSPWSDGSTVANSSGLVGLNLVDHPQLALGQLVLSPSADLAVLDGLTPRIDPEGGAPVLRWPILASAPQRAFETGAARLGVMLLPVRAVRTRWNRLANRVPRPLGGRTDALVVAGRLADAARQRRLDVPALARIPSMVAGLDEVVLPMVKRQASSRWSAERPHWPERSSIGGFHLLALAEQLPDPDNRIVLTDQVDALGWPRVRIHWQWSTADQERAERAADDVREVFEGLGLGSVMARRGRAALHKINSHHPAGTTPMSANASSGVVDADLRSHDHPNLYIVGSSVFNSYGYCNPTLAGVAFGLRLGCHLTGV